MSKKNLPMILIIAIAYFLWLILMAFIEFFTELNLPISMEIWCLIGIFLYLALILMEVFIYLGKKGKKGEVIKEGIKKVVCGYCKTKFNVSDKGERPLNYTCPNCGNEGFLRGKILKGISRLIECSNCKNEIEIFDIGERPLTYECPNCHFRGKQND